MKMTLRLQILLAMIVVTALTFAPKFYRGPGHWWVNHWGPASVAYEMFFMLLAFFFVPRRGAITPIAIGVCAATCALEFAQLWKPPWLMEIRGTFLGKALLGDTFSYWDLPAYPIGCLVGWFLLHWLCREPPTANSPGREAGVS